MEKFRAVKEHSQIDDMRAAIRGDLERSRARRASADAPVPEPVRVDAPKPAPKPLQMQRAKPAPEPEPARVDEPAVEVEPRRRLLGRLFRRR